MTTDSPIAVIGMAYRAPGIGRKGLWDYLAQARSAWTNVPASRFDQSAYFMPHADKAGVFHTEGAHFVEDVYGFDAAFFNMRAEEAKNSDPQHRMMLECALEAAEDAGHSLLDLAGKNIGVFVGAGHHEYSQRLSEDEFATGTFAGTGVATCMLANRISYFFDIDGPSVVTDAACASSVYAAHVAVSALRNGECSAAFVGASNLNLGPGGWLVLGKTGALSEHGRSYSYDEKASGFGRGEGAACMLIKNMDDALRDGDPIHAIIRSTACNHSGRSEGITMPSLLAQKKLLWVVHEAVGLDPIETPVVEGHGTGTAVGHLEGASGILAVVKAIMMLKNGIVLPTAGFEKINAKIEDHDKIKVAEMPLPWPKGEPRRVIVTNFGFGGSNSAIILEAAPSRCAENIHLTDRTNGTDGTNGVNGTDALNSLNGDGIATEDRRLFVFSARTEKNVTAYISSFDDYLGEAPESPDLAKNLSYTLGQRRTQFPCRVAVVADSIEDLQGKLATVKPTRTKERFIAFAFTGQGAQYARMALGLSRFRVFSETMREIEKHLQAMGATWSLSDELYKPVSQSRVNNAEISQPACTAVQLALVTLLQSWGITPRMVMGHSSGEIAAAFSAGLVSLEAAIAIAYFRGQAAARLARIQSHKGAMLALGADFEEASKLIEENSVGYATVAAINSPKSVTISGDVQAVENIEAAAEARGLFTRRLKVEMAYHSRHMEEVASFYLQAITPFFGKSAIPAPPNDAVYPMFVSSVTGNVENAIDSTYWIKNLVQPVRFADAIRRFYTMDEHDKTKAAPVMPNVILEIGPHAALRSPIKQTIEALKPLHSSTTYLPSLLRDADGQQAMLDLAGSLFTLGVPIQLGAVNQTDKSNARVLTELPQYAWDKSTSYELKPRAAIEKLFPGEPYHPLLGRRIISSGGKERAYRQVFTLDEMPWIRDHVVAGVTIFPMTGYMACAIEAARRTISTPAAAFLVRDFHVTRSLEISEEETVDMMTKLTPASLGEGTFSSSSWAFQISSWSEASGWTIHAWGQIEPEMTDMTMETPTFMSSLPLVDTTSDLIEHDIEATYASAGVRATRYGPTFRNTVRFWEGKGYTVLEHRLRDLGQALLMSDSRGSPVSIDPPTLDGFLQGGGPLQVDDEGRRPAQMPNYISRFRVSNKISSKPQQRFDVVMRRLDYDWKGGRMHVGVAAFARGEDGTLTPVAEWESGAFRSIGSADDNPDPAMSVPDNWAWEAIPRFDLLALDEVRKTLSVGDLGGEEAARGRRLENAACYYIERALAETAGDDYTRLPSHLSRFVRWATRTRDEYNVNFPTEPSELLHEVRTHDAQGALLCFIGEQLVPILRGEIEPLEIMLAEGRLTKHYEADVTNAHLSQVLGDLTSNLADLEPNLRILEIGGGTAGTTLPVMEGLSRGRDEPGFSNYTFTDISTGFFEMARHKLGRWAQRITYKRLDISQDPTDQGFTAQDFDIVVAANVLHATADMVATMTHVRSLLKPGGRLFLLEANCHPPPALPFCLLPGWWAAKDEYRDHSEGPMMSVDVWGRLLRDSGFSGVDVSIPGDWGADSQVVSIMVSTRVGRQDGNRSITVCGPFMDDEEVEYAQEVADAVSKHFGCSTETRPFAEVEAADEPYYIFIDSKDQSVMRDVTEEKFESLKTLLLHNTGMLWVVPEGAAPESKIILGLMRTLRMEVGAKQLLVIEDMPSTAAGISGILKLAETMRNPEVAPDQDQDFVWRNGSIHLPRMRQLKDVKERFAVERGISFRTVQNLWDGDRALEMTIDAAGSPDSIYFRRTDVVQEELGEDDVLVRVEAAGLSYRDLSLVLGAIPWAAPGYDGAGKVVKTGSRVAHLREGDSVLFLALEGSAFSTYKKLPSWHTARVPGNLSMEDAASLPLAYCLAVLALNHTARLRKDETVLIHSAAGAVGQACIVLAQHIGARIFTTAGTKDKRDFLHDNFGIPKECIFSSRTSEFRDSVLCATGGKGVDVIVNSLDGELMTETWTLAANFGRFVEIGKKDAFQNNSLPMRPFNNNVTFSGVDLRDLYTHRPEDLKDIFAQVLDLLRRDIVVPIQPLTAFPISQFSTALRRLKSGDNMGKIVITLGGDQSVMAESALRPSTVVMRPDATYVVTGGTRGIGLDLAYWMIDHGAKYVVVLGRSGGSGPEVQRLLKKYQDTDICVRALACNVGLRSELADVVQSIKDLPPVRGVVHSALLLSDKLVENATHEDWETVTIPRVQGAWNLHELMPDDLDFFVALSSFNGDTGNMGQAFYAGTAGFYDAFAQYRNALGRHTVSIALPIVVDVGYVFDNDLVETLKQTLGVTVTMADIRTIFKGAVSASGPTSAFHTNGRATAFKLYVDGQPVQDGLWTYFHPVHAKERVNADKDSRRKAGPGGAADVLSASWTTAEDPLVGLTEALITKVSSMTMIEREDVLPDAPLASYSLDSLVSVELRNWIRRETSVELTLSAITQAQSLRDLATDIISQRQDA